MLVRLLALAILAVLPAACGGGGSVPFPHPTTAPASPSPKPTVAAAKHVVISWSGAAHSIAASASAHRRAATSTVAIEPIEIGAADKFESEGLLQDSQAILAVTVTDSSGDPVAEPSPTVTIANAAVASYDAPMAYVNAGSAPAISSLTASFPDGSSGTLPIYVYAHFAIACPADTLYKSNPITEGISFASGSPVAVAAPAAADVYLTGPGCDPAFASGTQTTLNFPNGYQAFAASTPVGSITNALPFVPIGTSVLASTVENGVTSTAAIYLFKTSTGLFVKWRIDESGCDGDRTNCEAGATDGGLYAVSDTTGAFAD